MSDEGIVYVGKKSMGRYVSAIMTQIDMHGDVSVKARGRSQIGKAVEAAELSSNKHDTTIDSIETETHTTENEAGEEYSVTAVSIDVSE